MIPSTWSVAVGLCVVALLLWGSWANTFKAARGWRFELYYLDFVFGAVLAALLTAFTLGEMGEGLTVMDNLLITGKRQMAVSFIAGGVFNLGNMLLMASISLAGLASGFGITFGIALLISVVWMMVTGAGGALTFYIGAGLIGIAVVQAFIVAGSEAGAAGKTGALVGKGMALAAGAGILIGIALPLLQSTMLGEIGLVAYSAGMLFAAGMAVSTVVFNFYFMNLPVAGPPLSLLSYVKGSGATHMRGLAGGLLWYAGLLAILVAAGAPAETGISPEFSLSLGYGGAAVAILWGVLVWKEVTASSRQRLMAVAMAVLLAAGVALVASSVSRVSAVPAVTQSAQPLLQRTS